MQVMFELLARTLLHVKPERFANINMDVPKAKLFNMLDLLRR